MITRDALAAALLDVGRTVTDEDAALFSKIDPAAADAPFAATILIRARFGRPIPPPQVHRVMDALREARSQ